MQVTITICNWCNYVLLVLHSLIPRLVRPANEAKRSVLNHSNKKLYPNWTTIVYLLNLALRNTIRLISITCQTKGVYLPITITNPRASTKEKNAKRCLSLECSSHLYQNLSVPLCTHHWHDWSRLEAVLGSLQGNLQREVYSALASIFQ